MDNLNLTNDRDTRNVWDDTAIAGLADRLRALDPARSFILAGAAAIAAMGLRRRGVLGALLTATGGALVYRALTGHDDLRHARGWGEAQLRESGWIRPNPVDDAAEASFPASDPPSH